MGSLFSKLARLSALSFGKKSEAVAARELKRMGYKIIEMNFHCREGEIDIIAREGETIIFCEVKARRSDKFGSALEGITQAKIAKLKKAAEVYINRNRLEKVDARFDVVAIDEREGERKLEVLRNAF